MEPARPIGSETSPHGGPDRTATQSPYVHVALKSPYTIKTAVVDICPLGANTAIMATPTDQPTAIPDAITSVQRERLLEALHGEKRFLEKLGTQLPDISGLSLEEVVAKFEKAQAGKVGLRELAVNIRDIARRQLVGEQQEEMGSRASTVELTGILLDKLALHHEVIFTITSKSTLAEHVEMAKNNDFADSPVAFREDLIFMRCTPENIEKLLCDLTAPFPTTHAPAYLLLGARLEDKNGGSSARWLHRVTDRMEKNYARIDARCDGGQYSPNRNATDQGLPEGRSEFTRLFGDDVVHAPVTRAR